MFTTLAKSGLVRFWRVQPQPVAPGLHRAPLSNTACSNGNLPGFRRPVAAGKRRSPTPALACHWVFRGGRLECCWHFEPHARPSGGFDADQNSAPGRACGRPTLRSRNLALAG
jgi:hypothetical protein